jgi:hypothetical protein
MKIASAVLCAGGSSNAAAMKKYLSRKSPLPHLHTVGQADGKSRDRQKKLESYPIYHPEPEWQETNNVDDGGLSSSFLTSACRLDK